MRRDTLGNLGETKEICSSCQLTPQTPMKTKSRQGSCGCWQPQRRTSQKMIFLRYLKDANTCPRYGPQYNFRMSSPSRILAIDFGSRRMGLAVSDPLGITDQGIETIQQKNKRADLGRLQRVIGEYEVQEIVLGLPLKLTGEHGPQSQVMEFSEELRQIISSTDAPVGRKAYLGSSKPRAARGSRADVRGVEMKRCTQCHGPRNDPLTVAPSRLDWHLAPEKMAFESKPGLAKSGPQLCGDLKDWNKHGNRNLNQLLVRTVETGRLVLWSWEPGVRASGKATATPPVAIDDEFVSEFKKCVAKGAPCPDK